jgi:abnormal spindle-like microcephaly-associated protein
LHIGLETVFGEILPVSSLSDIIGISQFILNRLLSNPDILAQYAHPTGE